jgi:hypothetical protein
MGLTQVQLRKQLRYDPRTGWFTWRTQPNGRVPEGRRAGTIKTRGNREIKIDGKLYQSGRLAFFYMDGRWPKNDVDHRNGNPADDRWTNLRKATRSQNAANQRQWGKKISGLPKGVYQQGRRYYARIKVDQTVIHLGGFDEVAEAQDAYAAAAKKHFGQFARIE